MVLTSIYEAIKKSKNIAIFTHVRADGDCLGAGVAMFYALKNMGKENIGLYNAEPIHKNYKFFTLDIVQNSMSFKPDLMIALDCGKLTRLGYFEPEFKKHDNTINIDHHISNEMFATLNFVQDKASSTCEILYNFFTQFNIAIDKNIANALFCGLSADTGCFMHSNTTKNVHYIASKLMEYDLDIEQINYHLFKTKTKKQITLTAHALSNLQYFHGGKVAICGLDRKTYKLINANDEDDPRLADMISGIEGVKIGICYNQNIDGGYNISFRTSCADVDVNLVAQTYGGGGHKKAAGCKIYASKQKMIQSLVENSGRFI